MTDEFHCMEKSWYTLSKFSLLVKELAILTCTLR